MTQVRSLVRSCAVVLGLISLAVVALAGCGGGSNTATSSGPVKGGTLNVGLSSEPKTMDPLNSSLYVDREVQLNIYDTLVTIDSKGAIQPDLATSWTYTDPKTLVFTLRPDVKFQDGTPFDASAVVFNIKRILTAGSKSPRYAEISTISSATAVDSTHAQFNLTKAFSPLLANLTDRSGEMLSPTALQQAGADPINNPAGMGTGPFEFKTWAHGDHINLVRNPNYWNKDSSGGALPYLDGVTYKFITDGTVMYTNLQANSIQYADAISAQSVSAAQKNASVTYKTAAGLSFFGFELNVKKAPLDDVHVRRAIAYAVNPQEIVHSVLLDNGVVAHGPISPASWAYDASIAPFTHDVSQAKAELAQASTQNPTFTLLITSGSAATTQEATFIQSELKEAGITVNLQPETFAKLTDDTDAENYQAALIGWSGRVDPDGNMYNWFHTGAGFNQMQYSNADVDTALDDARIQTDQAARAADYQKAEKQILQDSPYIFIDHGTVGQISTSKLQNFTILPTGIPIFGAVYLSK